MGSFSWTCWWWAWSYMVTGPVIPCATFCCQLSFCLEFLNLRSTYFLRFWVPYGTSLPPGVGVLANIWVSFMAHKTRENFFSLHFPLMVQSYRCTSCHMQCRKNFFLYASLWQYSSVAAAPYWTGSQAEGKVSERVCSHPRQHLGEWGTSFDVLLFFGVYLSISEV